MTPIELKNQASAFYKSFNNMVSEIHPQIIYTLGELILCFNPRIIFNEDVKKKLPYSDECLKAAKFKISIGLMISSKGDMLPPVIGFSEKDFKAFSIPGEENALIIGCKDSEFREEVNTSTIFPHYAKHMGSFGIILYNSSSSCNKTKKPFDVPFFIYIFSKFFICK